MKVEFDADDLQPLVESVVDTVLQRVDSAHSKLCERLSFTEAEAADLMGVEKYVLRDCRLRGELQGTQIGKRICYTREELTKFLIRNRVD